MLEKKTSKEWYDELYPNKDVKILDPDGWDRNNFIFSFHEEKIDLEEFMSRLYLSTISRIPQK